MMVRKMRKQQAPKEPFPWRVIVTNLDGSRPDWWPFRTRNAAREFARTFGNEDGLLRIRVRHYTNLPARGT